MSTHLHILGICGTFMGGIAQLAQSFGYRVTGADANVYPPMSTQLEQAGIDLTEGWDPAQLTPAPDQVVIGNALSRGNPVVEAVLDSGLPYTSGPQWLAENLLQDRWVLAVAGTHGKTTTASMLAWILDHAGLEPGFLIGGVADGFGVSARAGNAPFFVVEADEYDSAFFDKRSKFVHYRPRTLITNNLEFDHADIFDDLEQIQRQFHHLVRTVPGNGKIISPLDDGHLLDVLDMGCWTPVEYFSPAMEADWHAVDVAPDGSRFEVICEGVSAGAVDWGQLGAHNVANALAALAAARHAGVPPAAGVAALNQFSGVRRRLELRGEVAGIRVYDDFAHHPTAIRTTLTGLRASVDGARIVAVLEPRSNTMRQGVHAEALPEALQAADRILLCAGSELDWDAKKIMRPLGARATVLPDVDAVLDTLREELCCGDHVLIMSNGGFDAIHSRLLDSLKQTETAS